MKKLLCLSALMIIFAAATALAQEKPAPEAPKAPEAAVTPEAPKAPEAAVTPEAPKAPEAAVTPEAPKAPEAAVTPEDSKAPEAAVTPEAPKAPEAAVTPEAPKAPEAAVTPEAPKALEAAVTPEAPKAPEAKPRKKSSSSTKSAPKNEAQVRPDPSGGLAGVYVQCPQKDPAQCLAAAEEFRLIFPDSQPNPYLIIQQNGTGYLAPDDRFTVSFNWQPLGGDVFQMKMQDAKKTKVEFQRSGLMLVSAKNGDVYFQALTDQEWNPVPEPFKKKKSGDRR